MSAPAISMERTLWHLIVGTRGGLKRAEIISLLERRPYNAHEISRLLAVDYKTARHHLRVLVENGVLVVDEGVYGALYFWSARLVAMRAEWDVIWKAVSTGDRQAAIRRPRRADASVKDSGDLPG
ncbi:MAG: winged helix-turn-helix domain-containing protein [Thermoplasmatota archaeon]